jgi:hypothetical protein
MIIMDCNKQAEEYFTSDKKWQGAEVLNLLPLDDEFVMRFTVPHKINIDGAIESFGLGGQIAECSFWSFPAHKGQPIFCDDVEIVKAAPIGGWHVIGELTLDGYLCCSNYFCDKQGKLYFSENARTGLNLVYDSDDPQTKDEGYTAIATILMHICCLAIAERNKQRS